MNILDFIPYGKDNAVTRQELVRATGLDDRSVRDEISKLRARGEFILSSSSHVGYWRSNDQTEIAEYFKECDNRRNALSMPEMKRRFYKMTGQRYTLVKEHLRRIG